MRLTKYWTNTAEEAYGMSGMKGRYGELLFIQMLGKRQIHATDCESSRSKQLAGIDVEVGKHTIDVKSNLENHQFYIEVGPLGWLFNPQKTSDIIVHIDVATLDIVWYLREIARTKIVCNADRDLIKITKSNFRPDFMNTDCTTLCELITS